MKRNMDLIRAMLFALEAGEIDEGTQMPKIPTEIEGFSQQEQMYHAALIIEGGLAEGAVAEGGFGQVLRADLDKLTWAGHDFLDAARDDTIWNKAKEKLLKPGASFTFELLKEWLKAEVRMKLGLG